MTQPEKVQYTATAHTMGGWDGASRSDDGRLDVKLSTPGTPGTGTNPARVFDGQREGLTRDDVLDNVTLYWLTNTTVSSARLYWESKLAFFAPKHVAIPVAVSAFPDELYQAPRSWTERAYPKLIYYNKLDKGGHFAAWEQPELFVAELRAAFRSLR